jgi:hypothetical protein
MAAPTADRQTVLSVWTPLLRSRGCHRRRQGGVSDPEKQRLLIQDLQRFQWEDVPWLKCGEAYSLRAMREEIIGYDNPTDWYLWNCGFAS